MSYIMALIISVLCVIQYLIPFRREHEQAINKGFLDVELCDYMKFTVSQVLSK